MTVDKEYKLQMIANDLHCSTMGLFAKIQEQAIVTEEALANAAEINEKHKNGGKKLDSLLLRKAVMDAANSIAKLHALLAVLTVSPALRMYEDFVEKEIDKLFVKAIEGKLSEVDEALFNEQGRLREEASQINFDNVTEGKPVPNGPVMVTMPDPF